MNEDLKEAIEITLNKFNCLKKELEDEIPGQRAWECGLCKLAKKEDKNNKLYSCPHCKFPNHPTKVDLILRCEAALFNDKTVNYEDIEYIQGCLDFYEEWLETGVAPKIEKWKGEID